MRALLDLPNPANDITSLRTFYDSTENHIRGLSSLGQSQNSYGALIIPIILGKLPMETRCNVSREHSNLEWTIDELQSAILKEIQILEQALFVASSTSPMNTHGPMPPFTLALDRLNQQIPEVFLIRKLYVFTVREHTQPIVVK